MAEASPFPDRGAGPALVADGVTVAPGGRRVVHPTDVRVDVGERVAIVGPNGAGKTSLLRVLAGLARPATGRVRVFGADLARLRDRDRARAIAYVAQDEHTDLPYRARDVLLLGRSAGRGDWHRYDDRDRAAVTALAERWDLDGLLDRTLDRLSGGERRRILLARAFAQEAALTILDEPTNHLDLRHQHELLSHLRDTGATAVLTLHDLDLATAYCTRVLVMDRGDVVVDAAPERALTAETVQRVYGVRATAVDIEGRRRVLIG